jgi:hypothetical protein
MKQKQHERFQKIFYENLYLLKITDSSHQINFDVSGSTSNIYQVKILKSFEWNNIFCNCPDAKKWANIHDVFCKHTIFIIFKVLKLFTFKNTLSTITVNNDAESFLDKRKLHRDYLEVISVFLDVFNFNQDTDFMKLDYVNKYNTIKEKIDKCESDKCDEDVKMLVPKENEVGYCLICFDDFNKDTMYSREINSQCLVCKSIFHIECLTKWFAHNQSCPSCRSPSKLNTQNENNQNESQYINLFGI